MKNLDEYKNGRLSVIKEMSKWLQSELDSLPKEHKNTHDRATVGGYKRACIKALEKLKAKEKRTLTFKS